MKNIFYFILFISILISNTYCTNGDNSNGQNGQSNTSTTQQNNYDDLAKEYCECSTEIVFLNKKMQKLNEEGKFEEMGDLLSEIESKSSKQTACQEKLELQYKTKIDTSKAVLSAIKRVCPELGGFMENAKKEVE